MTDAPVSARTLTCAACGAAAHEGARRCGYCRAPIATLRCATCFHMNMADAAHCSGCGRALGLEPVGEDSALACPHCKSALLRFGVGAGALYDCGGCGGQFVEHAALRELLEEHERGGLVAPAGKRPRAVEPVHYVPCPECGALMNRKNFGVTSGVIVDVCKKHGTWFDAGELPRVLAFVESGGLDRAHEREQQEAAQRKRDELVKAFSAAPASAPTHAREAQDLVSLLLDVLLQ